MKKVPPPPSGKRKGPPPPRPPAASKNLTLEPHPQLEQTPQVVEQEAKQEIKPQQSQLPAPATIEENNQENPQAESFDDGLEQPLEQKQQVEMKQQPPPSQVSVPTPKKAPAPSRGAPPPMKNKPKIPPKPKLEQIQPDPLPQPQPQSSQVEQQAPQISQTANFNFVDKPQQNIRQVPIQPQQNTQHPPVVPQPQLSDNKFQLYEKLMQLRKAKEAMQEDVQDYDVQEQEEEVELQEQQDTVRQEEQQIPKEQHINYEPERTQEPVVETFQQSAIATPSFQPASNPKSEEYGLNMPEGREVKGEAPVLAKIAPPAPAKNKSGTTKKGIPAPPVRKAPNLQPPKPTQTQVEPPPQQQTEQTAPENNTISEPVSQPSQQQPFSEQPHHHPSTVQPSKTETIVRVTIPKPDTTPLSDINALLQRYNSLKSTYIANMHSLQQLVDFQKREEQAEVDKIKHLMDGLAKKNERIRELCKLRIPAVSVEEEQQEETV